MLTYPENIRKLILRKHILTGLTVCAYILGIAALIFATTERSTPMIIAFAICFFAGMLLFMPLSKAVVNVRTATAQWLEEKVIRNYLDIQEIRPEENVINMLERDTFLVPGYKQLVESDSYLGEYRGHKLEICNWQIREKVRGGFLWMQEHEFIYYNQRQWHCPGLLNFGSNVQMYSKNDEKKQLAEILSIFEDDVRLDPVRVSDVDFDEEIAVFCDDPDEVLKVLSEDFLKALTGLCRDRGMILCIVHQDVFLLADQKEFDKKHDIRTEEDAERISAAYEDDIRSVLPVIDSLIDGRKAM